MLTGCVQVEDILKPNALDMLLFVLYLYQALPQLVPRATVEFMGRLQEKQVVLVLDTMNQAPHKCQKCRVPRSLQQSGASGTETVAGLLQLLRCTGIRREEVSASKNDSLLPSTCLLLLHL